MWRISTDFWDDWESLLHNFTLVNAWSPFIGKGHWPDADMLPVGRLSLNGRPHGPERQTNLTKYEQETLMTLWAFAKSPMMIGADLITLDNETLTLLTNKFIIDINQNSVENGMLYSRGDLVVWYAESTENADKYFVSFFNVGEETLKVDFPIENLHLRGNFRCSDIWSGEIFDISSPKISLTINTHGTKAYEMVKIK